MTADDKFLVREKVRTSLRKLPPAATIQLLRAIFVLPSKPARLILHDTLKPRQVQRSWMKKVTWESNWKGYWIGENVGELDSAGIAQRAKAADLLIFFVHGGAFRVGTPTMYIDTHVKWLQILKEEHGLNAMMVSVRYGLAPEHKYPVPVQDVVRAYEHIYADLGIPSSKIIVAGDSAGGALILECLFRTHDPSSFAALNGEEISTKEPFSRPAGLLLVSPLVSDQTNSASWKRNAKYDIITQTTAKIVKREYFPRDLTKKIPFLEVANWETGFKRWIPDSVLVLLGGREVMLDDGVTLARKLKKDGLNVELVVEEEQIHDWFLVREVVKDKQMLDKADKMFCRFVANAVNDDSRMLGIEETIPTKIGVDKFPAMADVTGGNVYVEAVLA